MGSMDHDDPYRTRYLGAFEIAGRVLHVRAHGRDALWLSEETDSGSLVTLATVSWSAHAPPALHFSPRPSPWVAPHSPLATEIIDQALLLHRHQWGAEDPTGRRTGSDTGPPSMV